jgi:hypothetical protein
VRFLWLLLLLACDPIYTLHLRVRVRSEGAPAARVWVLALDGASQAARTGEDGTADARFSGLNRNPAASPIAIAARGDRLFVALPGRDFTPRKSGSHEFEASLDLELRSVSPSLVLRCEGERCTVTGIDLRCASYEVSLADARASSRPLVLDRADSAFQRIAGGTTAVVSVCGQEVSSSGMVQ